MSAGLNVSVITVDRKPGGIAVAFLNYVKCLDLLGFKLRIIIPESASHLRSSLSTFLAKHRIEYLTPFDILAMRTLKTVRPTIREAIRGSDIIITHNNILCDALSRTRVPIIAVCHSDKWRHLNHADVAVVLSRAAEKQCRESGVPKETIHLLPHYFEPTSRENAYGSKPTEPFIVAAAGRFVKNKGFPDFIAAAKLMGRDKRDLQFILAGAGEEDRHLRRFAESIGSPVEFAGWMNTRELAAKSHVFCLTSQREPFGYVLCEMLDQGVPCISTPTNGPLDVLDGNAGIFYQGGNAANLAEKIEQLYSSQAKRIELSARGFQRIRDHEFSIDLFVERLSKLISQVTEP